MEEEKNAVERCSEIIAQGLPELICAATFIDGRIN